MAPFRHKLAATSNRIALDRANVRRGAATPQGVPLLLGSSGAASYRPALRATRAPRLTPLSATCAALLTPRTGRRRGRLGVSII